MGSFRVSMQLSLPSLPFKELLSLVGLMEVGRQQSLKQYRFVCLELNPTFTKKARLQAASLTISFFYLKLIGMLLRVRGVLSN